MRTRLIGLLATVAAVTGTAAPALAIPIMGSSDPANNSVDFNFTRASLLPMRASVENRSSYDALIAGRSVRGGDPRDGIAVDFTPVFDFFGSFGEKLRWLDNVLVRSRQADAGGQGSGTGYGCVRRPCEPAQAPEPSALALLGLGLMIGGAAVAWRRRSVRA